jgi:response regulator RpfG family c-di-GMP phosphodiesterase
MAVRCPHITEAKFRLLYLGNDLSFLAALRKALTEADYQLVSCSHRGSAIMFLESEIPYDTLLIDFEWQGTEGLKLAPLVHSLRHRKRMPIMLVAAGGLNSQLKKLASEAGVKKCVKKTPVDAVGEAIRQLVETPARKK